MPKRFGKSTRELIMKFLLHRDGDMCIGCNNKLEEREKIDLAHIDENPDNNDPCNLRLMHHSCNQKARNELIKKLGKVTAGVVREREIVDEQPSCNDSTITIEMNYEYEPAFRSWVFARLLGASKNNEQVTRVALVADGAEFVGCSPTVAYRYMTKLLAPTFGPLEVARTIGSKRYIRFKLAEDYTLTVEELQARYPKEGQRTVLYRGQRDHILGA